MTATLIHGDVREALATLDSESVQCVVTSPPYFGLRDYGVDGQIGLEPTPDAYVAALVDVFRDVRRVLRDDGVVFLNLGDSYYGAGQRGSQFGSCAPQPLWADKGNAERGHKRGTPHPDHGLKFKDLIGIPWMVAFALRADGWYLRSDIIWAKPNPMPESVRDRPTKAHEYLFLLTKRDRYYYDAAAIAEPCVAGANGSTFTGGKTEAPRPNTGQGERHDGDTRNKRSVWTIATQPYAEAHFATFPEALIEPCVLAGSREGDTVLDPFAGSGTVGVVALRHGRSFVGIDLSGEYVAMAKRRIEQDAPLFNRVEVM